MAPRYLASNGVKSPRAEQGHAKTQCNLGVLYNYGQGVEVDNAKAVDLFEKLA